MRPDQFKVNSTKMIKYQKKKKNKATEIAEKYISQESERAAMLGEKEDQIINEANTSRTADAMNG